MKKSNLLKGAAAVVLGLAAVGCSHEIGGGEADLRAQIIAEYNEMFIKTFGRPAADQDWGFGTSGTRSAVDPWGKTADSHDWEDGFTKLFIAEKNLPETAVDLTDPNLDQNLWFEGIGYIPSTYTKGDVVKCKVTAPATVYIYGTIEDLDMDVHGSGPVTFYNVGTATAFAPNAGSSHIIYNEGTMNVVKTSNIDKLYNKKDLTFETIEVTRDNDRNASNNWQGNIVSVEHKPAFLDSKMTVYSSSDGATVELPYGGIWEAACHIDHIVDTYGDLDIQTGTTGKYFCGIRSVNDDYILIDSDITTSYIKVGTMELRSDNIYLTKEGYIIANEISFAGDGKTEEVNGSDYEAIKVEPYSIALVDSKKYTFQNGESTLPEHLGNGVYATNSPDVANQYDATNPTVGGVSKCGGEWGTPDEGNTGDGDGDDDDDDDDDEWVFKGRVFAEDLTASETSDFDFNDVVFDVYYSANQTKIVLQAAGGTLPLYVEGFEVHGLFGVNTNVMVNTGTAGGLNIENGLKAKEDIYLPENVALKDIKIAVKKDGVDEPIELIAPEGKATAKFVVTEKVKWCNERQDIAKRYPSFRTWVGNTATQWYGSNDIDK